jgi:hypothetical protein
LNLHTAKSLAVPRTVFDRLPNLLVEVQGSGLRADRNKGPVLNTVSTMNGEGIHQSNSTITHLRLGFVWQPV